MRRLFSALLVFGLIASSCTGAAEETTSSRPPPTTTQPATTTSIPSTTTTTDPVPQIGSAAGAFTSFEIEPLRDDSTGYAGPQTPSSLDDVLVAPVIYDQVNDPELLGTLSANGFVVVPGQGKLFHHAYGAAPYDPYPVFVTTDAAYHVWHLAFSKVLRETEQRVLLPILEDFVAGGLQAARDQQEELSGSELADPATRVVEWFQVAGALLGLDVGTLGPRAAAELDLATATGELTTSPVMAFAECNPAVSIAGCVDYTQYRPRGHYTRTVDLERYFRAMSHLGQSAFALDQPESLRLGLLVSRLVAGDAELGTQWELLYEPTAFLVGIADDYTPFEAVSAAGDLRDAAALGDPGAVAAIGDRLLAGRAVAINPEAAAIRVMGARFVLDSYILDQMAWPNLGTNSDRRIHVSPLDVAAAFGSEFAYGLQDSAGETAYLHYDDQLDRARAIVGSRQADDWAATVYDAWLYALEPMWSSHGTAFPDFMQTDAWAAKDQQTGFASYTELKHDTILYAKQGFAVEGDFQPEYFEPRHWVEPDPVAFHRIGDVAALTREGLDDRGLLTGDTDRLLGDVIDFVDRLAGIAEDELAGNPISDDDNRWLESVGSVMELIWMASADFDPATGLPDIDDEDTAVVADIFRTTFDILELGTGRIDQIYVLVPNDDGVFQIAAGGVYSYYEFWRSAEEGRLTDAEWRAMLDRGDAPERPAWQRLFGPGAAGSDALPGRVETFLGMPRGKYCRDLHPFGFSYADAYDYWEWEGRPDRMDADRNGVPCETVYPAEEIEAFLGAGTAAPETTTTTTTTTTLASTTTQGSSDPVRGELLATNTCSACHGSSFEGIPGLGPSLHSNPFVQSLTDEALAVLLALGRPASHPDNTTGVDMPPRGGNPSLGNNDLADISAFLWTLQYEVAQ